MKTYSYADKPLKLYGLADFEKNGRLQRLPDELMEKIPSLQFYGRRCTGARLCFRTDSPEVTVKMVLKTLSLDLGMSMYGVQSILIYAGDRKSPVYLGNACSGSYDNKTIEKCFKKENIMEDIMIILPRNEQIESLTVSVEDNAAVEAPTPYRIEKPVVFYGSSITEGGCATIPTNAYTALVSRHLDVNYLNLGFSGSAKGEPEMAEYIKSLSMTAFVLDYDHNAPTPEYLRQTHEPFFKIIREAQPLLPILIMSRPSAYDMDGDAERRTVIRDTYQHAKEKGDKNVYFLDGASFFGDCDRAFCTVDTIHPNDVGFHRMASKVEDVLSEILYGDGKQFER